MYMPHHYIDRVSGNVVEERFLGDRVIGLLYHPVRENAPKLFSILTSCRISRWLAFARYDAPWRRMVPNFIKAGFNLSECLEPDAVMKNPRAFFERKIKYWDCRPLEGGARSVTSPADARMFIGSLSDHSLLFIKEKFFDLTELLGSAKEWWINSFRHGDFAVFRLTPDKYHYNHSPVSGIVVDFYAVEGSYHSCNPSALMALSDAYSKNKRVVTIIDTDVPEGTGLGLVAMIEVVALMIGDIVQCYSRHGYDSPLQIEKGMFLEKGAPKSLFRPGSSTVILLFEKGRMQFSADLQRNVQRQDVQSRLCQGLSGRKVVETDVRVRSEIGQATIVRSK